MTSHNRPTPRQMTPDFECPTVGGDQWSLSSVTPENFTMVVFYRGLHCPICKGYLKDLDNKLDDFKKLGVEVIVVSNDPEDRATTTKADWRLDNLTIGYGIDIATARSWGLYVSSGIGKTSTGIEEPDRFAEPGIFLVRPDQTLYFASIQTMPFARPRFEDVLKAIEIVVSRDYPARGEVID